MGSGWRIVRAGPLIVIEEAMTMSDSATTPQKPKSAGTSEKKFRNMGLLEKGAFVGKAVLFLLTFGFAFPNIFVD